MSGGERGRRNTGYWATFNNWWRAHLEKHGERPKAEDLKRWFREESRLAFPNDPPTYTMIRNHAKGLRDIASVKHYFRDYRARKRRAVADLAGEPSPRSDPDEEDNSGGTGSPSDDACTSDEDWQGDSKKRRQNRERRKKRTQQDAKQLQSAACTSKQQQLQQPSGAAAGREHAEASAAAFEEQGDLTVTVTVTHSKRETSRCVPRLESPLSSASPTGPRAPPLQQQVPPQWAPQQLHLQQLQHHLDAPASIAQQSGAVTAAPDSTCHAPSQAALWGPGFGWRSAHGHETLQSGGGGESTAPGRGFPDCTAGEPGGAGPVLQVGLHNQAQHQQLYYMQQLQRQHQLLQQHNTHHTHEGSAPGGSMEQQPPPCGESSRRDAPAVHPSLVRPAEAKPAEEMAAAQPQQQQQLSMDPHVFPPPHSHGPGRGMAGPGRGSYGAGEAWGAAAAAGAAAPHAPGAPATHLSPMSSQPVPPADAASTSSTDMHRGGGRLPAADLSASGSVNPEAACAGGGAATGGAATGQADALGLVKNEELYIGLHSPAAGLFRDRPVGGGGPYGGLSLRIPSSSVGGNQAQPWTPFAIPMLGGSEPRHPAATAAAAPAGGAAAMESVSPRTAGGATHDMQSSISPSRQRSPLAGPSLHPMASDCAVAAATGGNPGLLSSTPDSAPIPVDAAAADLQRVAWLQRQRSQYHSMGLGGRPCGSGGGGRGADMLEHATSSGRGHMHGSPAGPSPLSVVSPHAGAGNSLGTGRQISLPVNLLGGAGLQVAPGAGSFQSGGDAKLQQQQTLSLAAPGPPPVTTGFTPSKGAPRAAAVSSASGGGGVGAVALQAGSPGAGQVPAPLAGQIVLTGAGSSPAAGGPAALPSTIVDASSPGGAATAAGAVTAAATATNAAGATPPAVAAEANQDSKGEPKASAMPRSGLPPAAASRNSAGIAGSGVWSGEQSPGAVPCAWSLAPLRTKAPPPAVPFPAPFPPVSPAAAAAASSLSPTHSGGLTPGIATNSPSGRFRWMPYPPVLHQRAGTPSPWYPYSYPTAQPGHPVPSPRAVGFPAPYVSYGRPLVRRRYVSAPSCAQPLPPVPHPLPPQPQPLQHLHHEQPLQQQHLQEQHQQLHQHYVMQQYQQQQQQQQQQYPGAHSQPSGAPPGMPVGMGTAWPGGRPGSARAQSFSMVNADPWVGGPGYEDARSPTLASAASAPAPPMSDGMDHRRYMTDVLRLGDMQMAGWAVDGGGCYGLGPPPMETTAATAGVALPMGSAAPGAPPASDTGSDEGIIANIFGICLRDEAMPVFFGGGEELGRGGGGGEGMAGAAPMQPGAAGGGGEPGPDMPGMMMGCYAQQDAHGAGASYRGF